MLIIDIPLELITITQKKRCKGSFLIGALLSLLILPGITFAIHEFWDYIAGTIPDFVSHICALTGIISTFSVFLYLLARFFFARQPTVTIHVAPENVEICFWLERKKRPEIQDVLNEIESRKSTITENITHPMRFAIRDTMRKPWRRTLARIYLFSIPALITEIPWLLLASVIPIMIHILSAIMAANEPSELRQAERHYLRREWDQARNVVMSPNHCIHSR